jgi:hypothetical protein
MKKISFILLSIYCRYTNMQQGKVILYRLGQALKAPGG